jgi:opacity protein-like surface antigen
MFSIRVYSGITGSIWMSNLKVIIPIIILSFLTPSAARSWDGLYFGINGGYGVAKLNNRQSDFSWYGNSFSYISPYDPTFRYSGSYASGNYTGISTMPLGASGASAGGQIGYLFTTQERLVIGPELSVNWMNIGVESSWEEERDSIFSYNGFSSLRSLNWQGVGLMRFGYDMGNFFPYVGIGMSFGQSSYAYNQMYVSGSSWNGNWYGYYDGASYSGSKISTGVAASGGVEAKLSDHLSIKGEYLYSEIGGPRIYGGSICEYCNQFNSYTWLSRTTDRIATHQVRAGLNYHISEIGTKAIVAPLNTQWTGLYIGAHGGYTGGLFKYAQQSQTYGGALAGGHIGVNYQFVNRIVLGAQASGSWTNLKTGSKTETNYFSYYNNDYQIRDYAPVHFSRGEAQNGNGFNGQDFRWLGLVLLKAGYSFEKFMLYFQGGGVATTFYETGMGTYYGFSKYEDSQNSSQNRTNVYFSPYAGGPGNNRTVAGGAIGAGFEYKLSDVLTFRSDYIYWNTRGPWVAKDRLSSHQVLGGLNLYVWTP